MAIYQGEKKVVVAAINIFSPDYRFAFDYRWE